MTKFQQKIWPFEKFVAKYVFFFKIFKISICDIHRKNKGIFKIQCWCSLILSEIPIFGNFYLSFLVNLFQKIKIVYWSWKLVPRLIWTCRIWWWFSFFSFPYCKHIFWANLFQKKFKLFVEAENLSIDYFEYLKFTVMFTFSVLDLLFARFVQNIHLSWLIAQQFTSRDLKPVAFFIHNISKWIDV